MRELKFRVWNGIEMEYNIMVGKFGVFYVNPLNNGIDEKDAASLSPYNTKYSTNILLMQFTGLLDSTGKEIYEDDICKVEEGYFGDFKESEFIGKVEFEDGCYFINDLKTNQYQSLDYAAIKNRNIKILGNVYQNLELLNVT